MDGVKRVVEPWPIAHNEQMRWVDREICIIINLWWPTENCNPLIMTLLLRWSFSPFVVLTGTFLFAFIALYSGQEYCASANLDNTPQHNIKLTDDDRSGWTILWRIRRSRRRRRCSMLNTTGDDDNSFLFIIVLCCWPNWLEIRRSLHIQNLTKIS